MDPLAGSTWSRPDTVAGFEQSAANAVLLRFAEVERRRAGRRRALDLGCGAARNAIPLARMGWHVTGLDLSWPMLASAGSRAREAALADRVRLIASPMDEIPARRGAFDLIVAHGIWNLARSSAEFRHAVAEAARVAAPGAGLFVFTFSRGTLADDAAPVPGEPFVFTQFSGEPQCFLTGSELVAELADAGFTLDPSVPLTEDNRRRPGSLLAATAPVIHEATFRRAG
jgi:SAM-dependent methyltransferase